MIRCARASLSGLMLFSFFFCPYAEAQTSELGRLRVSKNGRFLVREAGKPVFLLGDTAWALPWKLNRDELVDYLDHRQKQRFNQIGIVAISPYDTSANAHGDKPFQLKGTPRTPKQPVATDESSSPTNSNKTDYDDEKLIKLKDKRWDPTRPITTEGSSPDDAVAYDYWDHLQYFIEQAEQRGMVVTLAPTYGELVTGDFGGTKLARIIFNNANAYSFGRWIGRRYKSHQNIIWMIGGDRNAVYGSKDYRPVFRAMAEGIADGVNGTNKQDGDADYSTTMMSYWPRKWQPNSSEWFHEDRWLDFNSIQDAAEDQIRAVTHDYELPNSKPTWLYEGRYEYHNKQFKAYQVRFQAYQTIFAGGFGHLYGNFRVYDFGRGMYTKAPDSQRDHWKKELSSPGADQMTHLRDLMVSLSSEQAYQRIPDQHLLDGDQGTGERTRSNRIQATRGAHGDYAFIYTANGRQIRVKMEHLAAPSMDAFWLNPRNGKWHVDGKESTKRTPFEVGVASGANAPIREFDTPGKIGDDNDWVLVLLASNSN